MFSNTRGRRNPSAASHEGRVGYFTPLGATTSVLQFAIHLVLLVLRRLFASLTDTNNTHTAMATAVMHAQHFGQHHLQPSSALYGSCTDAGPAHLQHSHYEDADESIFEAGASNPGGYDNLAPAKDAMIEAITACRMQWFQPHMSRRDAELALAHMMPGRFVIRSSTRKGFLSITVLKSDSVSCWNGLVKVCSDDGQLEMMGRAERWSSITELVYTLMTDDSCIDTFSLPSLLALP